VILIYVVLVGLRIARYAATDSSRPVMPAALMNDEERQLFLTPQGKYTAADIAANGPQLPSEKYSGFRAVHDVNPQPGDRLCPVTRTKGNPACTWIIDGQKYEFCCPPCISEFVRAARQAPDTPTTAEAQSAPDGR
jgi:hypothetical protein